MFSFLKRKPKVVPYVPEPMHFIGKCRADREYIQFGGNESFILFINQYLKDLHNHLIQGSTSSLQEIPQCHFLVVDDVNADLLVGLVGPSLDKSERENLFLLSRHIMNGFIKDYPLFVPLLYDEFYQQSGILINKHSDQHSLQSFQQTVSQLNSTAVFQNKQSMLDGSVEKLLAVPIKTYQASLAAKGRNLSIAELMAVWRSWRAQLKTIASDGAAFPVKIELPSDDNLNYYVAFVCQIIEPIFANLDYYRIIWWHDAHKNNAWCYITDQRIDPTKDLLFFTCDPNTAIRCLCHDVPLDIAQNEVAESLLDALQLIAT